MLKASQIENGQVMQGEVVIQGTAIALDIYWNLHARFYIRPDGSWKIGRYEDERRYSLRYKFAISRRWGQPSKPTEVQRLQIFKLFEAKYERMTLAQILDSEITILDYPVTGQYDRPAPTTRVNRRIHMDNNETKQVEVVRTQCTAVPAKTAKAVGRCPRFMTKENEFGLCGTHAAFYAKGAEITLIDGRILNEKPKAVVPEVQAEPQADFQVASPEVLAEAVPATDKPKAKKLSKKAKAEAALAVVQAADTQKAADVPTA